MTPGSMANEIVTAASGARREDARLVAEARAGLDQAAREIGNRLASARRGDKQNRWLYIFGGGGLVLGLVAREGVRWGKGGSDRVGLGGAVGIKKKNRRVK